MTAPRRLRLVKVVVQPHFVIDDGETLIEAGGQTHIVTAADWPEWTVKEFSEERLAELIAEIDGRTEPFQQVAG